MKEQISVEARLANNMAFMFSDYIETMLMVAESEFKTHGFALKHEHKRQFNALLSNSKKLKSIVSKIDEKKQFDWADDADRLFEIIMLSIDRVSHGGEEATKIIEFIKSMPSIENVNLKKFGL